MKDEGAIRILVTDRQTIESGLPVRSSYALISIRDPDAKRARVPKCSALKAIVHLAFHDAEPTANVRLPMRIVPMTEEHAAEIWRFVTRHKDQVGAFVVQCHQGMSRSPAVAAALAVYLGQDDRPFWREYAPNLHVYELMKRTMPGAGGRGKRRPRLKETNDAGNQG